MSTLWVLTYHSISPGPRPLCIERDGFARQLDTLLEAGWAAVPIARVFEPAADDAPARCFAVSFDDAYADFADAAFPVLEQRRIPATLFVPAAEQRTELKGGLPGRALLEPSQLRELAAAGVEIGAHMIDHSDLTRYSELGLVHELQATRDRLIDWTGGRVAYLAYPFGAFNGRVLRATEHEFDGAFTTQLAAVPRAAHPHAIPRIDAFYLEDPRFLRAARDGDASGYLTARRWLRRLRGSEPRRPIPTRALARFRSDTGHPAWS